MPSVLFSVCYVESTKGGLWNAHKGAFCFEKDTIFFQQ